MYFTKAAATCLIAGALAIGAPLAASAEVDDDSVGYVAPASVTVNPVALEPCTAATITFGAGYWAPDEGVAVAVEGYDAANAVVPEAQTASADGSLVTSFRPPADARAQYRVSFEGTTRSYTAVVSMVGDAGAVASCDASAVDSAALAATGSEPAPWLALAGGGLLVAGGAALAVRAVTRRRA